MGERIRAFDWASTALGPVENWSPALRTTLRIILANRFPHLLWWGPHYIQFYNDAYAPIPGAKHPDRALGRPGSQCWAEVWHVIGPLVDRPFHGGPATWDEDIFLELQRYGFTEECHFTIAYSPVPDETAPGGIGGVLGTVHEITDKVVGQRRTGILRDLAAGTGDARTEEEACTGAADVLSRYDKDIPFVLLYVIDSDRKGTRLAGCANVARGEDISPAAISLERGNDTGWPLGEVARGETIQTVEHLADRFRAVPRGPWRDPPDRAVVIPIPSNRPHEPAALMVAGISARLKFDQSYRDFFDLVKSQVATAIANARSYEEERRRAEALAELDRAKTAFFSNVSHEFRTPLTLMLGPIEDMLRRDAGLSSGARAQLEIVDRNGLRLLRLVNTLLDFSRIEAGRIQAVYEAVDLARLTEELASTFRSAMQRAGLVYEVDCPALAEPVHVDRDMWEKIVLNLISNAFKYTFEGQVTVSLRRLGANVELAVRDTGVGIAEEEIPRVFERFHRIEGQQGRTYEGTGIGLALVQELVRLHGGSVRVESRLGAGSAFIVSIPLGRAHLPAERIGAARSLASTAVQAGAFVEEALRWLEPSSGEFQFERDLIESDVSNNCAGHRPLILVADDNADMRAYLRRLLVTAYQVMSVPDGEVALKAVRERRPDLILTDIMMPRLSGFGLVRAIRADPELRDLPVMLLSARSGEEASVEGLEAGADDYLIKPFSARELLARVRANLELAETRKQAAAELRRLNETLEERIQDEIVRRLKAEEAFRQAQKMEALGQLTGGVAHDFNNLLQVISGNLNLIERRVSKGLLSEQDLRRLVENALRGTNRAATLTQRLLAFSRRQPLDPQSLDANRMVSGMSETLRRTLGEAISVQTSLASGLWPTFIDAGQLENALLNLAVNARDAMRNGGKLTISTANVHLDEAYASSHEEVKPGDYVRLAVSDTGIGMTEEVISHAFEPFFTTKDSGQGTGLGLSQVYGFVKQSGGHVRILSEPGRGTTVEIHVPRMMEVGTSVAVEELSPQCPIEGGGERILLVEDASDVRANTGTMLRESGYRVMEARDGPEALRLLETGAEVELLFTDIGLPGGLNGRQLADRARILKPRLNVLFTSGYAPSVIVHQGRLDGGVELISKPFSFAQLATKLHEIFGRRGERA